MSSKEKATKLLSDRLSLAHYHAKEIIELTYDLGTALAALPKYYKSEHMTNAEIYISDYTRWAADKDGTIAFQARFAEKTLKEKVLGRSRPRPSEAMKKLWKPYAMLIGKEETLEKAQEIGHRRAPEGCTTKAFECLHDAGAFAGLEAQKVADGRRIFERMKKVSPYHWEDNGGLY